MWRSLKRCFEPWPPKMYSMPSITTDIACSRGSGGLPSQFGRIHSQVSRLRQHTSFSRFFSGLRPPNTTYAPSQHSYHVKTPVTQSPSSIHSDTHTHTRARAHNQAQPRTARTHAPLHTLRTSLSLL
jgi:hypothetical protein